MSAYKRSPTTSGPISSTGIVRTGSGYLHSVCVTTSEMLSSSVVDIYDGTDASGVLICSIRVNANSPTFFLSTNSPIYFQSGLFAQVDGSIDQACVHSSRS